MYVKWINNLLHFSLLRLDTGFCFFCFFLKRVPSKSFWTNYGSLKQMRIPTDSSWRLHPTKGRCSLATQPLPPSVLGLSSPVPPRYFQGRSASQTNDPLMLSVPADALRHSTLSSRLLRDVLRIPTRGPRCLCPGRSGPLSTGPRWATSPRLSSLLCSLPARAF